MGQRKEITAETNPLDPLKTLSVIVPMIPEDVLWKDLLQDLKFLPAESEIILVGPTAPDSKILEKSIFNLIANIRYVYSERGRAKQLNAGVKSAKGNFLWFLHADTKVPRASLIHLATAIKTKPHVFHYFRLHYLGDGPRIVHLNSVLANWQARYFGMPFGEQGYAMSRALFVRLGGFSESNYYGEDHLLVWQAKRKKLLFNEIPAYLFTSARRFQSMGWGRLTGLRLWLNLRLATAESIKLLKYRVVE